MLFGERMERDSRLDLNEVYVARKASAFEDASNKLKAFPMVVWRICFWILGVIGAHSIT